MPAPILQIKRGAAANIGIASLRAGEPGFTTDKYDFYIGLNGIANDQKFFGSHRYWAREDGTTSLRLKLVDKDGTNYVAIKAPDILAGIVTYRLPGTQGSLSSVLTNDGSGNLSWASGSANPVFTGIATFSGTTDNTLGNPDTGTVQIDGGLGIDKNVSIGGSLHVAGQSYFVGVVTFAGGTINLGDNNTDNINVGGEFVSNLTPNDDNTYDIGIGTQRWRNASFAGVVTATTFSGNTLQHSNGTQAATIDSVGNITASQNLTISGDLFVNGSTTQVNTTELTIYDRTITLGVTTAGTTPTTTSWDLGVLMNYGDAGVAKTAGVIWKYGNNDIERFQFATNTNNPGSGGDANAPDITVATFAPIEIKELWINDTAGQNVIASYLSLGGLYTDSPADRYLQNITVDAGTF